MTEDSRCCGTGTCMINAEGRCWCGQQWHGDTLCAGVDKADIQDSPGAQLPKATPGQLDVV